MRQELRKQECGQIRRRRQPTPPRQASRHRRRRKPRRGRQEKPARRQRPRPRLLMHGRRLPQQQAGPRPHGRPQPARRYQVADSARIASHDTDAGSPAGGSFGGGIHVGIAGAAHTARRRARVFQIVRLPACWGPRPQPGPESSAGVGRPEGRNTAYGKLEEGRIESRVSASRVLRRRMGGVVRASGSALNGQHERDTSPTGRGLDGRNTVHGSRRTSPGPTARPGLARTGPPALALMPGKQRRMAGIWTGNGRRRPKGLGGIWRHELCKPTGTWLRSRMSPKDASGGANLNGCLDRMSRCGAARVGDQRIRVLVDAEAGRHR